MKRTRNNLFVSTFIVAAVGIAVHGQSVRLPETDTQNWNDVYLSVPVAGPVDFVMQGTIRNGRNISRPVDERLGIGFSFDTFRSYTIWAGFAFCFGSLP